MIPNNSNPRRFSGPQVTAIVVAAVLATLGAIAALLFFNMSISEFRPVTLSTTEEAQLENKLAALDSTLSRGGKPAADAPAADEFEQESGSLKPERYSEEGASREVNFTERELNALLAKNTDLATRLAIDLSENLASAKLLLPLEPDFPLLGGKTLRLTAGLELRYVAGKPSVILKGISLWGVPLPNAWLGGIKNVDLVREFGGEEGFWKAFADGVEMIKVEEGKLHVTLKE